MRRAQRLPIPPTKRSSSGIPFLRLARCWTGTCLHIWGDRLKKPKSTAIEFGVYGFAPEKIEGFQEWPDFILAEVWAGYTHGFLAGTELSYVLRVQSSEIKSGTGNCMLAWGGLVLSKRL